MHLSSATRMYASGHRKGHLLPASVYNESVQVLHRVTSAVYQMLVHLLYACKQAPDGQSALQSCLQPCSEQRRHLPTANLTLRRVCAVCGPCKTWSARYNVGACDPSADVPACCCGLIGSRFGMYPAECYNVCVAMGFALCAYDLDAYGNKTENGCMGCYEYGKDACTSHAVADSRTEQRRVCKKNGCAS